MIETITALIKEAVEASLPDGTHYLTREMVIKDRFDRQNEIEDFKTWDMLCWLYHKKIDPQYFEDQWLPELVPPGDFDTFLKSVIEELA